MSDIDRKNRPYQSAGRSWRNRAQRNQAPPYTTTPAPPYGELVKELRVNDLDKSAKTFEEKAVISECSVVASYNWLNTQEPTILVPGRPPRWTPLPEPVSLPADSGAYFRDKNAARYPRHPMEPAIVAGLHAAPEICRREAVDVVACGSTLGNLLRFVRGEDKAFRILVEAVGGGSGGSGGGGAGTVFLIRRENSPTELIPEVRGYGHTFPEHYTTWGPDARGSTSHERLLRYRFGGLRFLVRFSADGYIEEEPGRSAATGKRSSPAASRTSAASVSELVSSLGDARISPEVVASVASSSGRSRLTIRAGGGLVDQGGIFDLKTRSSRRRSDDTLGGELPRMWVAQIPRFILAYHDWGVFRDIQIHDIREKVRAWEKAHNDDLSRLAALVHRIIALLRTESPGRVRKLELCHDGAGVLEVRQALPDTADALSPTVKAIWIAGRQGVTNKEKETTEPVGDGILEWKDDSEGDFTACSATCGYCGQCGS